MIRIDSSDKKPRTYMIGVISAIALVIIIILNFRLNEKSAGAVNLVISLYVLTVIILLIRAFIKQLKFDPYSYNTIYYFGFSVFLVSVFITHMSITVHYFSDPAYTQYLQMSSIAGNIASSAKTYIMYSMPFIFALSAALCAANVCLIRHEGRRFVNVLGIILAGILVAGGVIIFRADFYASGSMTEVMTHDLIVNILATFYLYFESMVIGAFAADIIAARYEPEKDKDYILILGCRPKNDGTPTPLLRARIERAAGFYKAQVEKTGKAPYIIPSGGQGSDERISESECMKNHLISLGIPEEHIILENQSKNTFENMTFSKKIIDERDPKARIAFSTTNYHVFRSGMYARRIHMRAQGMGAPTKWWFWPNAGVREFIGLLKGQKKKQALIISVMTAVYVVMTVLSFS